MLPVTQIDTFYSGLTLRHRDTINVAAGETFVKRRPEECYDLIENIPLTTMIGILPFKGINQQVKEVTHSCETYGGSHAYSDCPATIGQTQKVYAAGAYNQGESKPKQSKSKLPNRNQGNNHGNPPGNNQGKNQFFQGASHGQNPPPAYQAPAYQSPGYQAPVPQAPIPQPQVVTTTEFTNYMKENDAILKNKQTNMTSLTNSNLELNNMFGQFIKINTASSSGLRTLLSNTVTNPEEDLKGITTRSGIAYKGPTIPLPLLLLNTKDVQPPVVQVETQIPNSEPVVAPVVKPVKALVSALKPNLKPSIPYPSRLHDQKLRNKANDQKEKFFQIFQDLNFNISFANALILMPEFGPTIKSLLTNKEKLFKLARTPPNEHCSWSSSKSYQKSWGNPIHHACLFSLPERLKADNAHTDKDTYSASAEDIEVQSCFLDDQLTNLSPPRNCMPLDVLLRESRQPV
nr:hypothetical protein [Tanacetum cinerariifolium]